MPNKRLSLLNIISSFNPHSIYVVDFIITFHKLRKQNLKKLNNLLKKKKKKSPSQKIVKPIASSDVSDLSPILSINMKDGFHGHTLSLSLFSFYLSSSLFASSSSTQSCKYRYSLRWLWPPYPSTCIKGFFTSQNPIIGKSCQHFLQNRQNLIPFLSYKLL